MLDLFHAGYQDTINESIYLLPENEVAEDESWRNFGGVNKGNRRRCASCSRDKAMPVQLSLSPYALLRFNSSCIVTSGSMRRHTEQKASDIAKSAAPGV